MGLELLPCGSLLGMFLCKIGGSSIVVEYGVQLSFIIHLCFWSVALCVDVVQWFVETSYLACHLMDAINGQTAIFIIGFSFNFCREFSIIMPVDQDVQKWWFCRFYFVHV